MIQKDLYYTATRVAQEFGVTYTAVTHACLSGTLPHIKGHGPGQQREVSVMLVKGSDATAWAAKVPKRAPKEASAKKGKAKPAPKSTKGAKAAKAKPAPKAAAKATAKPGPKAKAAPKGAKAAKAKPALKAEAKPSPKAKSVVKAPRARPVSTTTAQVEPPKVTPDVSFGDHSTVENGES